MLQSGIAGLADSGGAYGVLAVCLILLYRTTSVLNFAIAGVGTFGAFVVSALAGHGLAYGPAAVLGILCGAAISILFGVIMTRWFFNTSSAYRAVVAIALLIGIEAVAQRVFGAYPRALPPVVGGSAFALDGVEVTWSGLIAFILAALITVGVTELLRRTPLGLQLRAIAQRPVTSELLGLRVRQISLGIWGVTGALATAAILLYAPGGPTDVPTLTFLVVPALAAALVGSFRRYRIATLAALVLAVLEGMLSFFQSLSQVQTIIPFAAVVLLLLWFERREVWDEAR